MIRKANFEDLEGVLAIVRKAVILMQDSGNDQWNSVYPSRDNFHDDIVSGDLYVDSERDGPVKSVICLNNHEPDEYAGVQWSLDKPALVIHRMAVDPLHHGKGLARKLIRFAEERAAELKLGYLRSDTCSRNAGMNALFKSSGYAIAGTIRFPGYQYDFNCYEKELGARESI